MDSVIVQAGDSVEVLVACDSPVEISKVFGPRSFGEVRITARMEDNSDWWVFERLTDDGWIEVCQITGSP